MRKVVSGIMKSLKLILGALFLIGGLSVSSVAVAQSGGATDQTDKSEEDWRKSQRKSTNEDPFDPFQTSGNPGLGSPLPPLRPIDQLPEESRRHIMSCLLYTSPSPRDATLSRMPSSA